MKPRSGWREPMIWLVVALPVASVVISIVLIVLALRGGSDDPVVDHVQRTGQVQVADLSPDARAAALKMGAVLQSDGSHVRVFPVGEHFARREAVVLTLMHPNRQAGDRVLRLEPDASGWQAAMQFEAEHDWVVQLADLRGSWRLRGRLPAGQNATHLGPSIEGR